VDAHAVQSVGHGRCVQVASAVRDNSLAEAVERQPGHVEDADHQLRAHIREEGASTRVGVHAGNSEHLMQERSTENTSRSTTQLKYAGR